VDGSPAVLKRLLGESGGHRWQRVPPTERRGRVHTSTVTVVVLESPEQKEWVLNEKDIQTFVTKDSGPGGQHRNKTESCVILRHLPTGIEAKAAARDQHANRRMARALLEARVKKHQESVQLSQLAEKRKVLAGSGMRGDKIRTYREMDDRVLDHRTGTKWSLQRIEKGNLDALLQSV
jgi:peptide chain release factor 1